MKYLTFAERKKIEKMLREKVSYREIAKIVNRSHTTISYEIKTNKMSYEREYNPELAHKRFLDRQIRKGNVGKLQKDPKLKGFIIEQLQKEQWSPEQIAGTLKMRNGKSVISHETIYQFIYSEEGKKKKLWLEMRHKKKPYRQKWGSRKRRTIIPNRVSIKERPKGANEKKEVGHLESDSMIFSGQRSQKCVITLLENKTAKETKMAIEGALEVYGLAEVKTITYDNGSENTKHDEINELYGMRSYFCRAYASWQKGLVENTNKLIRQYFPRYTNMKKITQDFVEGIQEKLNNRPRKSLNYFTPNQAYQIFAQGGRIRT
ncbi:IS30 family transposase [Candidatus Peregrinibacteria bacterium]|nr:IS30 family transposase [Candidatus Peregrinibacteria bacterium]